MAAVTERIQERTIEIKLPGLFSKMKVSLDGREMGVGVKSAKNTHSCTIHDSGSEFVVTLVEKILISGYELVIAKDGAVVVSRLVSRSGKELDARLGETPKWLFAFPFLAGAPIVLGGLIPALIGGAGAALGYKLLASFQGDRRKLIGLSILNIALTWTLIWFAVVGFSAGMLKAGWLRHNKAFIESTVEKTNAELPVKVDDYTTLTHARNVEDTLILSYTLTSLDPSTLDFLQLKSNVAPGTCADETMNEILRNGYWLRYEYVFEGSVVGLFDLSASDCGR